MPQFCFEYQHNVCFELFMCILIAVYSQRYDIHRHEICINKIFGISTIMLVYFIENKVPNTLSVSCFIMPKLFCQPFWTPSWTPMPKDDMMSSAGIWKSVSYRYKKTFKSRCPSLRTCHSFVLKISRILVLNYFCSSWLPYMVKDIISIGIEFA